MLVSFLDYIYCLLYCASKSQQMSCEASLSLETMDYQDHVREAAEDLAVTSLWYSLWSSASPRGQWKTGKVEKTGCKIICGAPMTLAIKGLMMIMMIMNFIDHVLLFFFPCLLFLFSCF